MAIRRRRSSNRQTKMWVPFDPNRSTLTFSNTVHAARDNDTMQISGIARSGANLQAPFNFLTSGDNTATNLEGQTVRIARPCTILAVSCASYIDTTEEYTAWAGLGIIPSSGSTTTINDLPQVMSSEAPGIWPYVSPNGAAPSNSGFAVLQKGKRRLQPGWLLYTSVAGFALGSEAGSNIGVYTQFRVLFGLD